MARANLALVNARIGDTLLVTPALRAIKRAEPEALLVARVHRDRAPLLEGLPFVDRVERLPRKALRALPLPARRRYDTAFCWADDRHSVAYCRRVAHRTVAFAGAWSDSQRGTSPDVIVVPRPSAPMHAVDERLLLALAVGIAPAGKRLAYVVRDDERVAARNWLASRGLDDDRPLVGLQLASFPGKSYRDWPVTRFAQLVEALANDRPALAFVALGDERSRAKARELARASGTPLCDATGERSLRETAALIARLRLFVGVDTGPTHLAGALGVPMVALYHCFHRGRFLAPLEHPALAVIEHPRADVECSRETPMEEIPVAPVVAACVRLLARDDANGGLARTVDTPAVAQSARARANDVPAAPAKAEAPAPRTPAAAALADDVPPAADR